MKFKILNSPTYDAPGEGAPGAPAADVKPAAAAAPAPSPESVLFPSEKPEAKPGEKPAVDPKAEVKPGDEKPAEWKEFAPDAEKTDAENAAAKVEHDKTKPAAPDALDVVPEDGKYQLTMPDGIAVDQVLLDKISPRLKAKGYTHREVQDLANDLAEVRTEEHAARMKTWGDRITGWVDTAKADKEIGGDKWDTTAKNAVRAVNTYGTPALKEYLEATGGGNHPELIRFMSKVGVSIKEDNPPLGGSEGNGAPVEAAHVLFPNDKPKG